jgi:very-short-patch-repair endonuclease
VTVPSRNGRKRQAGIRVHRSGRLRRDEVTVKNGIPVTTVARTLLDLADVLDRQALKRVITEAEYLNRLDMAALNAVVSANPGRRSAKLMEEAAGRRHRTRSKLEQRFLRLLERHRVEEPETGIWIEGYETDFLWRAAHLVVELDGLAAHRTTAAMKGDRRRDRILWRAGFRTMRLTEDELDEPEAVLDALAHAGVSVPSRSRVPSKPPRRSRTSSASVR